MSQEAQCERLWAFYFAKSYANRATDKIHNELVLEKHLCDVDASQCFKQQFVFACSGHKAAHWPRLWRPLLY